MKLSRQEFLVGWLGLLLAPGCGGDDDGGGTGGASGGGGSPGGGGAGGAGGGSAGSASGGSAGSASGGSAGSASGGSGGGGATCSKDLVASISKNHGHVLNVPMADIDAGVEETYNAKGSANHCHQVTLTAADFATLKAGGVVKKMSCNGTDHEYVLSCGTAPAPGAPDCAATPSLGTCV